MDRPLQHGNIQRMRRFILFLLTGLVCSISYAQTITTVRGVIKDAVTKEPLPFVTVIFNDTESGTFTDEDGEFILSNRINKTSVKVSLVGYKTLMFDVHPRVLTTEEIYLQPEDKALNEVIVNPRKEKYSKKNNPAVDLIKKVIAHKEENNIKSLDYYQYKEYERIFFAFNDFKPNQAPFNRYKFLSNYIDTSLIDHKAILPISVREKVTDVFYRKEPKDLKKIVKGWQVEGLDQSLETQSLDAIIKEVFKDVSVFDNSMTLLLHEFVSPLSEHSSVNFYRWYLSDTVSIDNDKYVKLDFAPFNSRDIGFTGNLYISLDSTYAVKRVVMRTPKKMNINFVETLIIQHDFEKTKDNHWIPKEERMAIEVSMLDAMKFYVDKVIAYEDFEVNQQMDPIFAMVSPIAFEKDYRKRPKDFWRNNRPSTYKKDYKMDKMMEDINGVALFRVLLESSNLITSGYIPTTGDFETSKLDIGTLPTVYSYNSQEGNRFRITTATTKNLHPQLFFYGYGAYGTRDNKFKYYGEATWALKKVKDHKDEFPKNNLILAYKYDINSLGQRYTQAERDNILRSLASTGDKKLTYNRQTQIAYDREYHNGFSFKLSGQTFSETPAGNLKFERENENGNVYQVNKLNTTEVMLALRYAPNEKFYQQRRKRNSIPSQRLIINLTHTMALKDVLGGQYEYNKTSFSASKRFWIAPYGKLSVSAQAEKLWGEAPFPFLITPSANNSYTIQNGSYYLIESLEFVHDAQVSWEVYHHLEGWLFNRIPLLKFLKWREVFGFRGFWGHLSKRNDPEFNHNLLLMPQETYTTNRNPYMEYNVGIENIFKFFRIDYVRRLSYLQHPNISKDGVRISFKMNF